MTFSSSMNNVSFLSLLSTALEACNWAEVKSLLAMGQKMGFVPASVKISNTDARTTQSRVYLKHLATQLLDKASAKPAKASASPSKVSAKPSKVSAKPSKVSAKPAKVSAKASEVVFGVLELLEAVSSPCSVVDVMAQAQGLQPFGLLYPLPDTPQHMLAKASINMLFPVYTLDMDELLTQAMDSYNTYHADEILLEVKQPATLTSPASFLYRITMNHLAHLAKDINISLCFHALVKVAVVTMDMLYHGSFMDALTDHLAS